MSYTVTIEHPIYAARGHWRVVLVSSLLLPYIVPCFTLYEPRLQYIVPQLCVLFYQKIFTLSKNGKSKSNFLTIQAKKIIHKQDRIVLFLSFFTHSFVAYPWFRFKNTEKIVWILGRGRPLACPFSNQILTYSRNLPVLRFFL